eukprot:4223673-Pyramimonas_sp.AAC.1
MQAGSTRHNAGDRKEAAGRRGGEEQQCPSRKEDSIRKVWEIQVMLTDAGLLGAALTDDGPRWLCLGA